MRIEYTPQTKIKNLETGDVFMYGNNVFMKVQRLTENDRLGNTVNLKNGFLEYLPDDTIIEVKTDAKHVL